MPALLAPALAALAAVLLALMVTAGPLVPPAAAAPSNPFCAQAPQPLPNAAGTPWPQVEFGSDRTRLFSQGSGVTVAVIDSGVDATSPQLGRVLPGLDTAAGRGAANTDCAGTGTQAAGIIAAKSLRNIGFHGIAPAATILPVRVFEDTQGVEHPVPAAALANAIDYAVQQGATVLSISVGIAADDPAVATAVQQAQDNDVLVVAAVGDQNDSGTPFFSEYPAKYPGVLAVGALDPYGIAWGNSRPAAYLDLVAPGADVVTTQIGKVLAAASGTRLAAAYVAGVAALVRSRYPQMKADQVAHRLTATAVAAPGGTDRQDYGLGLVNPYGALTDTLADTKPATIPGLPPASVDPVRAAHEAAWARGYRVAWWLTGAAGVLVLVTLVLAVAVPYGRRRRWRPGFAPPPPQPADEEPSPPVLLFEDQQQLQDHR
ncbi:MAG: S8 family serine peptidase [Micromonosporaceae bacterium]|nr:S8 family serine peptidase [Micromonosporaceae bacterium]